MWLARDKNGDLYIYSTKPLKRDEGEFENTSWNDIAIELSQKNDLLNLITWENSPIEISNIVLKAFESLE